MRLLEGPLRFEDVLAAERKRRPIHALRSLLRSASNMVGRFFADAQPDDIYPRVFSPAKVTAETPARIFYKSACKQYFGDFNPVKSWFMSEET